MAGVVDTEGLVIKGGSLGYFLFDILAIGRGMPMNEARIIKMANNVAIDAAASEFTGPMTHVRSAAKTEDEDEALSNVDQALDAMLAAVKVLSDNLPKIKVENVPQQAAVDNMQDILDTALQPYLADVLKSMQFFEK